MQLCNNNKITIERPRHIPIIVCLQSKKWKLCLIMLFPSTIGLFSLKHPITALICSSIPVTIRRTTELQVIRFCLAYSAAPFLWPTHSPIYHSAIRYTHTHMNASQRRSHQNNGPHHHHTHNTHNKVAPAVGPVNFMQHKLEHILPAACKQHAIILNKRIDARACVKVVSKLIYIYYILYAIHTLAWSFAKPDNRPRHKRQ